MLRTFWSFAAAMLLAAAVSAAPAPPAVPSREKTNARIAHDLRWFQATLRTTNPNCEAATDALAATAQWWGNDPARSGNEEERAWQGTKKAIKAGCEDARVLYINARTYDIVAKESVSESMRLAREAAAALDRSDAAPLLKIAGHVRAAQRIIEEARSKNETSAPAAVTQLDAAEPLWSDAAKDGDTPQTYLVDLFQAYLDTRRDLVKDRRTFATPVVDAFAKKPVLAQALRARLVLDLAWDARGNASIDRTSATAQKVFVTRLKEAETETMKLASLDATSPSVGPLMMAVLLGTDCDRKTMEDWFDYGLAVDPGNTALWYARLHHLEPRWNGSAAAMLEVGEEALSAQKFSLRVPFVLIFAHHQLAEDDESYFDDAGVCSDVRAVYEPYLKAHPDAHYERSGYAYLLYRCHDLPGTNREIKKLGTERRLGPFETKAKFDKIKIEAALNAH